MDSARKDLLVDALLAYGLNEYEARAYLALLQHGSAVAGDISRRSGIPRPRVYDTLQRLIEASLVTENGGSPRSYSPLPLDDFLGRMGAQFRRRQELLRDGLIDPAGDNRNDGVFHVHDETPILRQAEDLIDAAQRHLDLRGSGIDLMPLARAMRDAAARGVTIEGTTYGAAELPSGISLVAAPPADNRAGRGGRRLLIVRDREEVLIAELGGSNRPYAVRSRNRLLVEMGAPGAAGVPNRHSPGTAAFAGGS
ncbi:MAG TPA: helix-turn-helix domain-containing protein [Candidatus Eisenbacteria bacterium]